MKERYELLEARGNDGQIEYVKIAIHFEDDEGHVTTTHSSGKLLASVDADESEETIIHCALNAMGSKFVKNLREDARKELSKEEQSYDQIYYLSDREGASRCFVRLALARMGLLETIERHVATKIAEGTLSDEQRVLFEDAPEWRVDNPILNEVLDRDAVQLVIIVARDLEERAVRTNVFGT